jgi:hypothetical protein
MLRFLLFKFLPRRLLPVLLLYEVYKFVTRSRGRTTGRPAIDDRIIEGRATAVPASEHRIR